MKKRSRAGGGPIKGQRRKTPAPKRRNAPKATATVSALKKKKVDRLTYELREALDQQAATSEVLQVISRSSGDLEPVFATMLENIVRVCEATFGSVYRCQGNVFKFVAAHNSPLAYAQLIRRSPFRSGPRHFLGRMIATKSVDQVTDLAGEQGYLERRSEFVAAVEPGGVRTCLHVPMLKEDSNQ
jgi:two-component system, NtrC family, sensor kinase